MENSHKVLIALCVFTMFMMVALVTFALNVTRKIEALEQRIISTSERVNSIRDHHIQTDARVEEMIDEYNEIKRILGDER